MALIRSVFQDELDGVSQSLVDLSNMVAESIAKATKSILNDMDDAISQLHIWKINRYNEMNSLYQNKY